MTDILSNATIHEILARAVEQHQAGRLAEAESLYRRVLAHSPDQPDAWHLLGLIALAAGRGREAIDLIAHAASLLPTNADFRFSLGNAQHSLGRFEDAATSYRSAIGLAPDMAAAHNNLGLSLRELGQADASLAALQRAHELAPDAADVWKNCAMVLKEQSRLEEAEAAARKAVTLAPESASTLAELGSVLTKRDRRDEAIAVLRTAVSYGPHEAEIRDELGMALFVSTAQTRDRSRLEEALAHFRAAISVDPERWSAWDNMGNALARLDRFDEAAEAYARGAAILRKPGGGYDRHSTFRRTSCAKLVHDIEQIRYLDGLGRLGTEGGSLLARYESVLARLPSPSAQSHLVEFPLDLRREIGATYNRLWHVAEAPEIQGGAVNPGLDRTAVEKDYAGRAPGITWIDGLLTPEALRSLRRFCLESTVWFDCSYPHGYLGAFAEDGFVCPLLLEIGRELPARFPGIFGPHTLRKVWAFKYGDNIEGIAPHADFAAINVNFWITPDEANRDPASGGLVLWDKEAPPEWDFATYNQNQHAMGEFLRSSGAKAYTVPYRCNRAVIFNSDLIHRTDDIHFRPGYENRRTNVTFLYGIREGKL